MESRLRTILPFILSILLLIQSNPTGILGDETVSLTSEDSNECLTFTNVSHDYNYSQPPQYTFNISADLVNNCSDGVMYPSTLIKNDTSGIEISSDDNNWRYLIESNSSYPVEWQISRSQDIPDGTLVTFELHPTRDNCQTNCTESQNYSFQIVIAIGPIDISTCYGIGDIHHDYDANLSQNSFNLTAVLDNACPGGIHYPQGVLWNDTAGVSSNPPEGVANYGLSAYMIFSNTSTNATWNITLDSNISNGTSITFIIEPVCWMYKLDPMYMQDCNYTPLNSKEIVILIGLQDEPINQTDDILDSDGDSIPDGEDDCPNTPVGASVDTNGCQEENVVYDSSCPASHPYPSDPNGLGSDFHSMNWCCVNPYSIEFNECYPTYDEVPCPSGGNCSQYVDPLPDTDVIFHLSWTDSEGIKHIGTLQIKLYEEESPIHSANFLEHIRLGNYDGTIFHRIIDEFMIQGGDIQYSNGYGGYAAEWHGYCNGIAATECDSEDYTIPDEADNGFEHHPGILSMAKTQYPNTGGSQFFFVDRDSTPSHLDGIHTVFGAAIAGSIDGQNVSGIDVIDAISQVQIGNYDRPVYEVKILRAEIVVQEATDDEDSTNDKQNDTVDSGFLPGFPALLSIVALAIAALRTKKRRIDTSSDICKV